MEEQYKSVNIEKIMTQDEISPKHKKTIYYQQQQININSPLIFGNHDEQTIITNTFQNQQKVKAQYKNECLQKMYLDQSTQIQNQSNLIIHPLNHQIKHKFNSNVTDKSLCVKGYKSQQSKFDQQVKKMFNLKSKEKTNGKRFRQGYDELADKNLIQYLYTRQNKIFQEQEQTQSHYHPSQNIRNQSSHKIVRNEPHLASILRFDRNKNKKPFTIRKDCGRKQQYNIFDAISRQQSIKIAHTHKYRMIKSNVSMGKIQKQNKDHLTILKERMGQLQESVYHKVPFLLEMGVKFKYKN